MRAQFATFEALVSLLLAIAVAVYAGREVSSSIGNLDNARVSIAYSSAEYDFMRNLVSNASASSCMAEYLSGNSACMQAMLGAYDAVYGLGSLAVVVRNGSSDGIQQRCFPFEEGNLTRIICFVGD